MVEEATPRRCGRPEGYGSVGYVTLSSPTPPRCGVSRPGNVSAVRLAYGDKTILNAQPMLNWLNRMGEPLYGHETPDGYALTTAGWSGP
jgi:hypothetical protein